MKVFPEDPAFSIGEVGFDDVDVKGRKLDVLDRKPLGQRLTDLVDRIDQPLVIALDGSWGSGKSHFLKLWTGAHRRELGGKAEVIYFDAFEHDYLDDPLVSLVTRLTSEKAEETWGEMAVSAIKKKAFPLVKLAARLGLAAATQGATELVGLVGDKVFEKFGEAGDAAIDEFWKAEGGRIAAMQGFRHALTDLTKAGTEGGAPRKIVFIVDELDRCRPDYALTLLEIIKHFFAVPNVHFVLGTNLDALRHSVSARYGLGIDAPKYLQKFISIAMNFPTVAPSGQSNHASLKYFWSEHAQFILSADLANESREQLALMLQNQDVTLRDVQRILTCLALIPRSFDRMALGYKALVVGAAFLKVMQPTVYAKLRAQRVSLDEVSTGLGLDAPRNDTDRGRRYIHWALWAFALEGEEARKRQMVLQVHIDAAQSSFGGFYDSFSWRDAHQLFAEMFDDFTLSSG